MFDFLPHLPLPTCLNPLQHLDLELSEGFELCLEAGDELSELRNLRSLTISGEFVGNAAALSTPAATDVGMKGRQLQHRQAVACDTRTHTAPLPCRSLPPHICTSSSSPSSCPIQTNKHARMHTHTGGVFTPSSAERLLRCLARACPLLEELHVLPEPTCGLGDDQVRLVCVCGFAVQLCCAIVLKCRSHAGEANGVQGVSVCGYVVQLCWAACRY